MPQIFFQCILTTLKKPRSSLWYLTKMLVIWILNNIEKTCLQVEKKTCLHFTTFTRYDIQLTFRGYPIPNLVLFPLFYQKTTLFVQLTELHIIKKTQSKKII